MSPESTDYKEHDKIAESMGWFGKNGIYITPLALTVDTTACKADRINFGYCAAKAAGHITKW